MPRLISSYAFTACLFLLAFNIPMFAQKDKASKISVSQRKQEGAFPIVTGGKPATIHFDATEDRVIHIAAHALSTDVRMVSGLGPQLDSSADLKSYPIIIGTIGRSKHIDQLIGNGRIDVSRIKGQWETFSISVIDHPYSSTRQALVIVGSDPRGTAFGVFELSKLIGVQPFYWWADVVPDRRMELFVNKGMQIIGPPSVRYRGIFLNDEDWGLQPWAAKTFEPQTGDIGPKTYAKIFELLLRLKANLIWPAMHPSTKAFFHYPGNRTVANDYAIMVGSSHAEPMLRNNVGEWDEKTMGHFNYITNKQKVYQYWEERVKQNDGSDAIYTMGMRGVHDSRMEGVKDDKEAVPLLERIIEDQRGLLSKYVAQNVTIVPQVFTAYKEVLDIYDAGLKLPEDITLVWPDDNYGYIQRLSNEKESGRPGGSGVYYHGSYWGRPHDYLWLSTVNPLLTQSEMMKAYSNGTKRLWVLNVGDIKPLEYNIEQFLDMAFDAKPFLESRYAKDHLAKWVSTVFGKVDAKKIESILWRYYQLAFERKPEFMGWSQTEPTTQTNHTAYNHFFFGDEAQKRIDKYSTLEKEVKEIRNRMPANKKDAFYQLVYYPVVGASWMNKKFLYRDKAVFYARQNRLSAKDYATMSRAANDNIVKETEYFNQILAGGKWKEMMSMKPRNLPVFQPPVIPDLSFTTARSWSIAPEGFVKEDSSLVLEPGKMILPMFDNVHRQRYFIDLFLSKEQVVYWSATMLQAWIRLTSEKGILTPEVGKNQVRLWVDVDWNKAPKVDSLRGQIVFKAGGEEWVVAVRARRLQSPTTPNKYRSLENNGLVSFHAGSYTRQFGVGLYLWKMSEGLGYSGKAMQSINFGSAGELMLGDTLSIKKSKARLEYEFYIFTGSSAAVSVYTLPTHPLNNKLSMRYGVSVDDGPVTIVDFRTFGRSEEWKQNVLSNRAVRKVQLPFLEKGSHTLKIYAIDPGVVLDEVRIDLGGMKNAYSVITEAK
ncbi:MAG: glycosyl hydrolase 115 family protein [Chitinophagaceae bacterium]|nr:glycosyl hydrolase 115 family protein [Chitinophagaceae bacterium]